MALKLLLGLMALSTADAGVTGALSNVTATKEMLEPMETGNFLHCPCGVDCQTDLGKENGFQLQQSCSCSSCALRGARPAPDAAGNVSAAELLAMMAGEQEWDAASVPGDSQLLFCRCGVLDGAACRSCSTEETLRSSSRHGLTCPCGARCLRRLQWFGGNGWCVKRACIPCR